MGLDLMKKRIAVTGKTLREEMIRDGQNLIKEELEHDSSYSTTMFFFDSVNKIDDRLANLRVYGRKYSSLNGNYMNFLTTHDNPIKIGEYIHDTENDTYWLVYDSFNVNNIHYEGKIIQCNYLLKWQLSDGTIVERWANIVSASKYDVGESGNSTIILSSNNFTILIGFCEEGFALEGKRIFIDGKKENPTKVFKFTRSDDILYNSGNIGSILGFIADKDEFNPNTDRQDLRICDYIDVSVANPNTPLPPLQPDAPNKIPNLNATIDGVRNLKLGMSRTYYASVTDDKGNIVDWDDSYLWVVKSDFEVTQTQNGNKLDLVVEDESLIDSSFLICVVKDDLVLGCAEITIVGLA